MPHRASIGLLMILSALAGSCKKNVSTVTPPTPEVRTTGDVRLIAFGDWGLKSKDRPLVAGSMASYVSLHPADAALLLGDNFYMPLRTTEDPLIAELFENTYSKRQLNFPFYASLGNHDYATHDNLIELAYATRHPQTRWRMPARWYRVDFPDAVKPLVTVLMLDSNKQVLSDTDWNAQLRWIDQELSKPCGPWTMCCAHHTMFSNGAHGDNGVLQRDWGSLFTAHRLDIYLCGHDHTLQHLEVPNWTTSFVVSGGGAAGLRPMLRDDRGPFSRSQTGFAYLVFSADKADVRLLDGSGKLIHEFTRDTSGTINVSLNTPSDRATRKKLRVIQGLPESGSATAPVTMPTTLPQTRPAALSDNP